MTGKLDYSPSNVSPEDISGTANVADSPPVYSLLRMFIFLTIGATLHTTWWLQRSKKLVL